MVTFVVIELALRATCVRGADGGYLLSGRRLLPYRMPVAALRDALAAEVRGETFIAWDPDLGWRHRPGRTSQDGLYHVNEAGIRAPSTETKYSDAPAPGVLRVVLLGDSFTQGYEVTFQDTWGARLEAILKSKGRQVEVLNFGGAGYGMDQALLAFRHGARRTSPHVVLFGLQPENMLRNLNVLRAAYVRGDRASNPLTKPRFIPDGSSYRLINHPTISPAELSPLLDDLAGWDVMKHDAYYRPADYEDHLLLRSLVLSVAWTTWRGRPGPEDPYAPGSECARLARWILEQLASESRDAGASFFAVHLPSTAIPSAEQPYWPFVQGLRPKIPVIDTTAALRQASKDPAKLYLVQHYSPLGHRAVARAVSTVLMAPGALPRSAP